jgi:hypothetical protein
MEAFPENPVQKPAVPSENAPRLAVLSPAKFALFSILIAAGVWVAEFLFNLLLGKALAELSPSHRTIVSVLFLVALSIFIAATIYTIGKSWLMLTLASVILILFRVVFASVYFGIAAAGYMVLYTVASAALTVLLALAFISTFRVASRKFRFAKVTDIEYDVQDGESKTKYDTGICGNCGNRTRIARANSLSAALPKRQFHLCEKCGIFLQDNPVVSAFFAFAEIIFAVALFVGIAASTGADRSSTWQNAGLLFCLCTAIDGVRRGFSGIKAIMTSNTATREN